MITKADILKMVRRVHRASAGAPPRRMIYPLREWAIGVVGAMVLVLVICVASGLTYWYLSGLDARIDPVVPTTVRYNETTVARALEAYELRAARLSTLQRSAAAATTDLDSATITVATSSDSVTAGVPAETATSTPASATSTNPSEPMETDAESAPPTDIDVQSLRAS